MEPITYADLVWVATALLSRAQPERTGFSHREIRQKVYAIEPAREINDQTVRTHIARHCVANVKPDPGKHRKLYRNPDESYRLYRPGDDYHPDRRNGKTLPKPELLPAKYRELLNWYQSTSRSGGCVTPEKDPILALRGLGKELWKSLGGGEKFIRELRENWYGPASLPAETTGRNPRRKKVG